MAEETGKRKVDHIRICLDDRAQAKKATAGFEDIQLIHRALPEIDKTKIHLQTTFLGKKFSAPIIVKIAELIPAVEAGVKVTITGATKGLSIYRALTDQSVLGTEIEKA